MEDHGFFQWTPHNVGNSDALLTSHRVRVSEALWIPCKVQVFGACKSLKHLFGQFPLGCIQLSQILACVLFLVHFEFWILWEWMRFGFKINVMHSCLVSWSQKCSSPMTTKFLRSQNGFLVRTHLESPCAHIKTSQTFSWWQTGHAKAGFDDPEVGTSMTQNSFERVSGSLGRKMQWEHQHCVFKKCNDVHERVDGPGWLKGHGQFGHLLVGDTKAKIVHGFWSQVWVDCSLRRAQQQMTEWNQGICLSSLAKRIPKCFGISSSNDVTTFGLFGKWKQWSIAFEHFGKNAFVHEVDVTIPLKSPSATTPVI